MSSDIRIKVQDEKDGTKAIVVTKVPAEEKSIPVEAHLVGCPLDNKKFMEAEAIVKEAPKATAEEILKKITGAECRFEWVHEQISIQ